MSTSNPNPPGVKAAERGLAVLDSFIDQGTRGLAEIAKATGLAKPTVLRLLASLERAGYVVRLNDGDYQLGAKLLQLGTTYRANFRLDQHVMPTLEHLAASTQESATFHIREGDRRMSLAAKAAQITIIATFVLLCYLLSVFGLRGLYVLPLLFTALLVFYDLRPDLGQRVFPQLWTQR